MTLVVIDPGVLVSALISPTRAAPAVLVDHLLDGRIDALASPALIEELADVLDRPKFWRSGGGGRADAFIATLVEHLRIVDEPARVVGATTDPDDDYLVALAREHRADAIVSGDRHLLAAATSTLPVLTPRQALEQLIQ